MQVQGAMPQSKLHQRPKARHRYRNCPLDHADEFTLYNFHAFSPIAPSYFDAVSTVSNVSTVSTGPTDWQIMIVQFFSAASSSCIFQRCFSHLMLNLISISSRRPPQHRNHRALNNYVTSSTS